MQLLSSQVSQGMGNVSTQLAALQGESREITKRVGDLQIAQHQFTEHSSGLERLAESIDRHVQEFAEWRKGHEAENRAVSDHVTGFRGGIRALWTVGTLVIGLVVFTVQSQFASSAQDRLRIERQHDTDLSRVERQLELARIEREELKRMKGLK